MFDLPELAVLSAILTLAISQVRTSLLFLLHLFFSAVVGEREKSPRCSKVFCSSLLLLQNVFRNIWQKSWSFGELAAMYMQWGSHATNSHPLLMKLGWRVTVLYDERLTQIAFSTILNTIACLFLTKD